MDPLQVPIWKFLYQGLHNNWLRSISETYMPSLLTTLGPRSLRLNLSANFDLAILTSIASRPTDLAIKGPTSSRRKPLSRWRKTLPSRFNLGFPQQRQLTPLVTSQQRILELETELAKVKTTQGILLPLRPTWHFEHSKDDSYSTSTTRTLSFHIYV